MKYLVFILILVTHLSYAQSPHLHVDQFGYTPNAKKFAILSDPHFGDNNALSYTPADSLEIRGALSDQLIAKYEPTVWSNGQIDELWSGDSGWWLDFSDLTAEGVYYITDPISQDTSAIFEINYNTYDEALKASSRMFYYNRCNMEKAAPYAESNWTDSNNFLNPLQDANCRYIYEPTNPALEKDLSGGWFDAGDYNKYVTFTMETIHNLLWAYRENPDIFLDNNNIPESGNGIADILDELKWELDWLLKMTNPDGTVHIKMGSQNYNENSSSPPSNNTDQRFYGPTCTSSSLTIASVFAHAYTVYSTIPGMSTYANTLLANAESAWDYYEDKYNNGTLEYNCDDGSIVAGDADFNNDAYVEYSIGAAIYLFEATGASDYNSFIQAHYLDALVFGANANDPNNASTYYDDWWGINYVCARDAFLHYVNLPGHDAQVAADFEDSFEAMITNDWENLYGINQVALYRAYLPNYYLGWGSNSSQSSMGNMNLNVIKHGFDANNHDLYLERALAHLNYMHGTNPLGKLFLTNMYDKGGDRCADEMYHAWFADGTDYDNVFNSLYGPAPGYLTGGSNSSYTGTYAPPAGNPYLKTYADFNDSNLSAVSWEITEPAIYYQAAYIRLLSNIMGADQDNTTTGTIQATNSELEIHPNPIDQYFVLTGELGMYDIDILNASGQIVQNINAPGPEIIIDTDSLGPGIYFVRIKHQNLNNLSIQKIIKQ